MAEFFLMPAASPTMEEGRLVGWKVEEGDKIEAGDILAEVETDKATAEIESYDPGFLIKILRQAEDMVVVNTPIAIIGKSMDEDISELLSNFQNAPAASAAPVEEEEEPLAQAPNKTTAGPAALAKADELGVDIQSVSGTGPRGRVMSRDVRNAVSTSSGVEGYRWAGKEIHESIMELPLSFTPKINYPKRRFSAVNTGSIVNAPDETISNSMMRRTIAKRLKASYLDAPVFFLNAKFKCDALVAFRSQLKEAGVKVSYNDIMIKAVARALRDVPAVNASWSDDAITRHGRVNVGMAVALPDGLITPVINDADTLGLTNIAEQARSLATKARDKKLKPEEYAGSTFTISNLGMMQIEHFTAIINPPNSAILAVGSLQQEPVVENGELTVGYRMKVTMTCDHRVIDGALGADFLLAVRKYIETPALLAS